MRICPKCGEPVAIPEGEEEPPVGTVVRHDVCPTSERAEQYRYTATYTVERFVVGEAWAPEVLASFSDSMDARAYGDVAAELATKVGTKITDSIKHASLIDR